MSAITTVLPRLRGLLTTGLATLFLLTSAQQAQAFNPILQTWQSLYGPGTATNSQSGNNASCQLCHGSSTSTWNEYGNGLLNNGQDFGALEGLPSVNINGGTTMLDEINASTQPGWTTGANNNLYNRGGLITSTQTPPGGIGTLDPSAPPVNTPPTAIDDSATTPQDTPVTINVLANDTDPDVGDTLSVASVTQGSNGSVANNGNNVTYSPDAGFFGVDTFTYIATDGTDNSNAATVTVTVTQAGVNTPPTANNDTATTSQDVAINIDVLANDTDPDVGDILSVDSVTQGANGTVSNNGNNVTYSPDAGFFGVDTFTYIATDGTDTSNAATVTVTVNQAPPAGCTGINDLVADWDNKGNGRLSVSGTGIRDGILILSNAYDPNQIIATKNGNNGRISFKVNGRDLSPVPCRVEVNQPDVQICGQADVINAPLDCAPQPPAAQAPVARGDVYATPNGNANTNPPEDISLTVTASRLSGVLYNDFDADVSNPVPGVDLMAVNLDTTLTQGTVVLNPDGSFTYTRPAVAINPVQGDNNNITDTFTYQAQDADGNLSDVTTVVIQILPKQVDFKITMNYELGMHCTGFEFAYCCVLPPYNSILAQVIKPAQGDPAAAEGANFVDGFPRLLEGDPNVGLDGLNRETVVRDWDHNTNDIKKYQLRYFHDAQPRQEGNTSKPNTSSLISAVEGNSLQYFNTVFDSAQPDAGNALVYGPYNGYQNVVQGSGVIGDVPTDNYANAWLNHFYIYGNLEGHGNTGLEADKVRLGVAGQVAYPPDSGAALQPMGPTGNGAFENLLTFSADTGTVVFTQAKVLEDLPIMLTSPRIWEALGLPLTPFEDTIGFFADPGAVDEDAVRPYVAMKAQLHEYPSGIPVTGSNGEPVIGFGTAPIDIPNCERCHSAPSINPDTGNPNINSPNWNRPDASYPHGGPLAGTGLEDMTNLEYNFWLAYYDIVPGVDSDWYPRLKGAAINMLTLHDYDQGTSFTVNYAGVECTNNPDPTDPTIDPQSYACSHTNGLADLTNQSNIPQNTRLGSESVICQRCHADNVIANVKSATFDPAGQFPIPPITEAIHNQHRNAGDTTAGGEGGVIVFNDSLGRDGGCQGCHPAHRSDGVMDNYPITLGGDNINASGDNRLNPGGCFVGRDVHSNPMKDVDGAETPSYLTAMGEFLNTQVAQVNGEDRGIWCTNCHSQLSQEVWKTEDCNDLIRGDCLVNPRGAANLTDLATAIGWTLDQVINSLDPQVPGFDRTTDQTHAIWNPVNEDANVATIEVAVPGTGASCAPLTPVPNAEFGVDVCVSIDPDGDPSVNILSFCTTQDCVDRINANPTDQTQWRYPANPFMGTGTVGAAVPFRAATDGRDHWLAAGEPHCADCHQAPFTEQSGNFSPYPPFNYPAKASLMRYTRGHQDVSCQGCHESIHGLYPVTPAIDTTSYAQAAALNNDGSHGPLKCASCHTHVDANQIPTWVNNLVYNDPTTPGTDNIPVAGSYDTAVKWMHTYTAEANPAQDVCQNCHGPEVPEIGEAEYLEHSMVNRTSRVAMDNAERVVNNGQVFGETAGAQREALCSNCHNNGTRRTPNNCNQIWMRHLIEGRVSEVPWEEESALAGLGTCGW